jgi:uncharacterized protein YgiB involved in biofilm formation
MTPRALFVVAFLVLFSFVAFGAASRKLLSYGTEQACVASGRHAAEFCANAAANSRAEFDEKAPRFRSREACESEFPMSGCSIGFSGTDGWAGKKSGIFFTPRLTGFRILETERDTIVVPYVAGRVIGFSPRTVRRRDTHIDARAGEQTRDAWRVRSAGGAARPQATGDSQPAVPGAVPPPVPFDPNFDCAAVLEAGSDPVGGCYPAPTRRN